MEGTLQRTWGLNPGPPPLELGALPQSYTCHEALLQPVVVLVIMDQHPWTGTTLAYDWEGGGGGGAVGLPAYHPQLISSTVP